MLDRLRRAPPPTPPATTAADVSSFCESGPAHLCRRRRGKAANVVVVYGVRDACPRRLAVGPPRLSRSPVACSGGCSSPCAPRSLEELPPQKPGATEASVDPLAGLSPSINRSHARSNELAACDSDVPSLSPSFPTKGSRHTSTRASSRPTSDACELDALWAFGLLRERPVLRGWFRCSPGSSRTENVLLGFFVGRSRRIYIRKRVCDRSQHRRARDGPRAAARQRRRPLRSGDRRRAARRALRQRRGRHHHGRPRGRCPARQPSIDCPAQSILVGILYARLRRQHRRCPRRRASLFPRTGGRPLPGWRRVRGAESSSRAGMQGLDEVWANLPRGTFEIFHPDTYVKGLALPRIADSPLPAGCRAGFEGRMGELRTRAFLRVLHPRATALAGASGLLVDRYRLLEDCGEQACVPLASSVGRRGSGVAFRGLGEEAIRV